MKFAIVINNEVREYKDFPKQPECKYIDGLPTVRPVIEQDTPSYDPMFYRLDKTISIGNSSVTISYSAIPKPLIDCKSVKVQLITQDRDTAIAQNVTVHGRPWQADVESQRNLSNEILTVQAGIPMSPVWRDANNENMVLTDIQQLIDISAALKTQTLTAYQTSWLRKAAVEAATTVEELEII